MLQLKLREACEATTAHGLSRMVSGKPLFIRVAWLLLFLLFLAFFLRGLVGFVNKLQRRQVTTSLEAGSVTFQFPDVYACFENPVSGTYSVNMNDSVIQQLHASLNDTASILEYYARKTFPSSTPEYDLMAVNSFKTGYSFFYVPSLPFRLLVDSLAQRAEQSVLSSAMSLISGNGTFISKRVTFNNFYHSTFLRCFRWSLENSPELRSIQRRSSLDISLFIDDYGGASIPSLNGKSIESPVFITDGQIVRIPVSQWTLEPNDGTKPDRRSGVRIFLVPPGEYPTEFGRSFLLSPGQKHQVEVSMQMETRNSDQFDCVSNADRVQFLNPYDFAPYSHSYSYSYCYYDEYNKAALAALNFSVQGTPITWPLRDSKYLLNLTGTPKFLDSMLKYLSMPQAMPVPINVDEIATLVCKSRAPCSKLIYDARISSANWPTSTSLATFLGTTVATARDDAVVKGLSVPGLDFLVNASSGNSSISSAAIAFANANLLKLEIRPQRMDCDELKFSIDYGFENFVSDIGGIMGIYLGMSLLTICELFDLIAELLFLRQCSSGSRESDRVAHEA